MKTTEAPAGEREAQLAAFIEQLVGELEPLEHAHNHAYWLANTTGDSKHEEESARLDAQMRKIFARKEPFEFLKRVDAEGPLADAPLQRQLQLLLNAYRARQISPEMIEKTVRLEKGLESRFNNFRARLDGQPATDNQLLDVLHDSNDSAQRQRAWEASKQIGVEVVAELLELVQLRNQSARELGFTDYYSMSLQLDELDEAELFGILEALDRGTRPTWDTYKGDLDARLARRFGVDRAALRPWHYADFFFQEAPAAEIDLDRFYVDRSLEALAERYFSAIGFEIKDLLARADLYERPGKSQHAFCMTMDRGPDIRVLCNLRANEKWMGTLLHEFGHAVYDKYVDASLPFLLRSYAHILTTEASAMLFGRLAKNPVWMTTYAGADPAELAKDAEVVARAVREQLLVQTRWELVMIHMERALYRDPTQDLNTLWWDLVERYQGLTRPEGRNEPDWAAKIHFSVAPVYYHNYLLGEMMASQLQSHLLNELLGGGASAWSRYVTSPEVGAYLKSRLYHGGKRLNWRETLIRATGRPLDAAAFVNELAGRS